MTDLQKELIAIEVIRTLFRQFEKFPEDEINNRNAPFHQAFLNAFTEKLHNKVNSIPVFISLASWIHGLNTSLGQSFLENTAHILCDGEKKEFTTIKNNSLKISKSQRESINNIVTDLTNSKIKPDLDNENAKLIKDDNLELYATDFTVDVYYQDNSKIVCIELKTVKPNKGIFKVEKEKILEAKFALKNIFPDKEIIYLLGFPFDPLNETATGYNKTRFMNYSVGFTKYFAENEFLLSSELWDYLSGGTNTMETILAIINNIATSEFIEKFNFINKFENVSTKKEQYISSLNNWFLFSNVEIANRFDIFKEKASKDIKLQRILNQSLFDSDIKYRTNRIQTLNQYILEK